jgi:AcrR family transcriptional regulator
MPRKTPAAAIQQPSAAEHFTRAYAADRARRRGEHTNRRSTPADAFQLAREMFMQGRRIEMGTLARELRVSRGTLYRWVGNRERLIADLLWSSHEQLADWLKTKNRLNGAALIASRVEAYMHVVGNSGPFRTFLRREPDLAFRILTRRGTPLAIQERTVADLARLIERERGRGNYAPRLAPHTLASAIVRIIEGFIYNDIIAGIEPDLKGASEVVRALL